MPSTPKIESEDTLPATIECGLRRSQHERRRPSRFRDYVVLKTLFLSDSFQRLGQVETVLIKLVFFVFLFARFLKEGGCYITMYHMLRCTNMLLPYCRTDLCILYTLQRSATRTRSAPVGGAPQLSKSTHPRKFGNHVTVHRPPTDRPSAPQDNQCLLSHFQLVWEPKRKLIAHQCCDQLTAVKTGHSLTSITRPQRGLKYRPIEVEYFFEVIR